MFEHRLDARVAQSRPAGEFVRQVCEQDPGVDIGEGRDRRCFGITGGYAQYVVDLRTQLVESAQARWRAVNGSHLAPLVRAGVRFERGLLVERSEMIAA
ncbi:hypothetical protein ACGFYQ_38905 [Streptomyces sp. NPDC048258]|uniref:hypothetical protein n=1 Tax=Streptomyces sp. NPDC048258 TaxID=3365527 RepID=UPI003722F4FC